MPIDPHVPVISKASRLIVFAAFIAMVAGSLGLFTWMVVAPALATGVPPPTWSWSTIALFEGGLLVGLAWLGAGIYKRFTTKLSSSGVSVPTLQGRSLLPWSQVERVRVAGHEIRLYGQGSSVVVNVFCFTKPEQVGKFISTNLPTNLPGQNAA